MKKLILVIVIISNFAIANDAEEFFYQRGYETGMQQGYQKGAEAAFNEAKKILEKYKAEIKAYEIGKYLIKSGYLTYPKVWQRVDDDGNLKIEVQASKIVKQLNISEIFDKFNELPNVPYNENITNPIDVQKNSVYVSERDQSSASVPALAGSNQDIMYITILKSGKNEEILKKSNLVYSIDTEKNRLKIMFFNRAEKENFCKQVKICD
ncbi:hypothetical protein CFT12S00416_07965 [Campylobacter fetus subsp. testudinum]|uniref:hypothetical protein n=1 Tax=Campylobacter fetus TaxID=196 RepID=UPI0008189E03|nr:hypothetical protein [Campylobacter fetus]OCR87753.1 hypothetical protein CFT12S00416_07965 [Campylobacter fetus subsp. testudinum]